LKRYDITYTGDEGNLIAQIADGKTSLQYCVRNENLFDVLHEVHLNTGNGGKRRMRAEKMLLKK
jgi:hypothetical protein